MDLSFSDFFDKGGPVMYLLAILSCYLTAIIIFKFIQFFKYGKISHNIINNVLAETRHSPEKALSYLKSQKGGVVRIMEIVLQNLIKNPTMTKKQLDVIESEGNSILRYFESHMKGLEMIANLSPLMGLLGTVTGMVSAFAALASSSKVDPSLLAGGIWEALMTTVAGLTLAIPAMAFHYYFESRIEKIRFTMDVVVTKLVSDEFSFNAGINYRHNMQNEAHSKFEMS